MAQNIKEKRFTMEFTRPTGGVPYTAQDGVFSASSCTTGSEATNTDVNLTFIAIPPNSSNLATDPGYTQTANDAALYAQIVATAAYTPGSAEQFFLEVILIRIDE